MLLVGWWWQSTRPTARELLQKANAALAIGDYESADAYCQQVLNQDGQSVPALMLAGEAAMRAERYDDAVEYFHAVPHSDSNDSVAAMFSAAEVSRVNGYPGDAERDYRHVLKWRPLHAFAHERLAFILDLQGRRWESTTHLFEQLRQNRISYSTLIRLGSRDSAVPFPDELDKIRQANRDPAVVKLAEAVDAMAHFQPATAEPLLREAIRLKPELIEAHVRLGRLLVDREPSGVPAWQRSLPAQAESHPDVWITRGQWSQHVGQTRAAIRCFGKAATLDPNLRIAHYQLSQLLADSEFTGAAGEFAERSRLLQELAAIMNQLSLNRGDGPTMGTASEVLEQLGRHWEAYGWCQLQIAAGSGDASVRLRMERLSVKLTSKLLMTDPNSNPAISLDFLTFPLPEWPAPNEKSLPARLSPDTDSGSQIQFVDRAAESGLRFTYFNADDPDVVGTRMYEFSGGGIGVLDYDADGLPDLYLTQGCTWPPDTESTVHRDRLFRNLGDGGYRDVTNNARLGDGWFSQGVAIGDLNNDGYPDIYVANIGRNRLYHNNGDGTFRDVTNHAGLSGQQWTTSCLIADLDGDQSPDIYDVNYLKGDDLFDRLCQVDGRKRACAPGVFSAERDRIYLSQGEGRFHEVTGITAAVLNPPRAGLGIVASDMDGSGRLSLFVANDVAANAFLINETSAGGGELILRENALLAGLAFDREGRAQACMGIAAEDIDGNGLLDFFVTNYYEEANSLYLQTAPGVFIESSHVAGLYDASFRQLGFGTQFLDGDLDGWTDLVVANGHLDDFQYLNIPFRMKPQFFSNRGDGRFRNPPQQTSGDYFDRELLGRSAATLDWNCDGRPDFAVLHLETPAALLTNETQRTGRWLKIRLQGVLSARDAIGSTVTLRCGDRVWTRQLTAGSGYQASNEKMLLFGVSDCEKIDRLIVRWPSGIRQTFDDIKPNRELTIIELGTAPFERPSSR
jgi:tetratricopeptide (TPR) repeat protein